MSPLIDATELRERLDDVTVLDVRWRLGGPPGGAEHVAGHVPGAAYVDLPLALTDPVGDGSRGRHPLPDVDRFGAAMRAAGVRQDRPVVVYDDWGGRAAARCWWLLRWAGHDDVRVLDGGWSAWRNAGGAVEEGPVSPPPGDFRPQPGAMPVVDAAGAAAVAEAGLLLDAREPERYRGDNEPVDPVAGHVPGARNVPTSANLGPDGRFRDPTDLATTYAAARGAGATGPVAVYCGSGVTATHDLLALAVLGADAALYPGSWSEWVSDPSRPVATGERPRGTAAP